MSLSQADYRQKGKETIGTGLVAMGLSAVIILFDLSSTIGWYIGGALDMFGTGYIMMGLAMLKRDKTFKNDPELRKKHNEFYDELNEVERGVGRREKE